MSMTINKELPNPAALKAEFPVPEHIKEIKAARDKEIACRVPAESPINFSSSSAPARRITKKVSANTPAALPV